MRNYLVYLLFCSKFSTKIWKLFVQCQFGLNGKNIFKELDLLIELASCLLSSIPDSEKNFKSKPFFDSTEKENPIMR